jgi:hypothetical protein
MLNAIRSSPGLAFASVIAWRSDPAPLSFVLVTVNVAGPPPVTTVDAVALLLPAAGSVLLVETDAVLTTVPVAVGVTTMLIEADAPLASDPSVQETVVVPVHEPVEGVADTNVTVAGSVSVMVTFVAVSGPRLDTPMV